MPDHGEQRSAQADRREAGFSRRDSSPGTGARVKAFQDAEHALTPRQAIKAYPMAIFWTVMMSMSVIMEGVCVS
jgi:hypothetical protein